VKMGLPSALLARLFVLTQSQIVPDAIVDVRLLNEIPSSLDFIQQSKINNQQFVIAES